jgi:cysteine-rich repeat protein
MGRPRARTWVLSLYAAALGMLAGCSPDVVCGDGVVQGTEACDDGNLVADDACTDRCLLPACGDGILQSPEGCDDGNAWDDDACTTTCRPARCGDGALQADEGCDDGNDNPYDACTNACVAATCGDGVVRAGVEACDDGNTSDEDGCTTACARSTCGDGFVQPGEACDDGNTNDADGCRTSCVLPSCGDGVVQPGEACDDGDADPFDACTDGCAVAVCGDGFLRAGVEACDDGNVVDDDGCTDRCALPSCGDGRVQAGEGCDDGNADDADDCLTTCLPASCGDGVVQAGEACDDGNHDPFDGCVACAIAICGDGVVQAGVEACDDGNAVDDDGCTAACARPSCGDGVLQAGEACDDGNADESDACLSTCLRATCGDGVVQAGFEACDDGDMDSTDACVSCSLAFCGDGVIRVGVEVCDDGNDADHDTCTSTCAPPLCGDGLLQPGEACDDGDADDTNGCTHACTLPACGDRIVQAPEACDDGNADPHDGCTAACGLAVCGDGIVRVGVEACDDGNGVDTDGCTTSCALRTCGDGAVQPGEACDDGNRDDRDGCTSICLPPTCGDGVVQPGEACDDGDTDDTDACTSTCALSRCGDGLVQDVEACDDANLEDTDSCTSMCTIAACGDGAVHAGVEACDDGNASDGDGCTTSCAQARCGDGHRWVGVELCDDGNRSDTDACTAACAPARCGDGLVWADREACDDANRDDTDGCLQTCARFDLCEGFMLAQVEPDTACVGDVPDQIQLIGGGLGFLYIDGAPPEVTLNGQPATVLSATDCEPVYGALADVQGCATLTVALPSPAPLGGYDIAVTQPTTAACSDVGTFSVAPPPHLTGVSVPEVCGDLAFEVIVEGSDLLARTDVALVDDLGGTWWPDRQEVVPGGLRLSWDAGVPPGTYDVYASGGANCDDLLPDALVVRARPIVFFVDPPVSYNGVDLVGTVYVANVNGGGVVDARARRVGDAPFFSLPFQSSADATSRVYVTFPAGLVGIGEKATFEIAITDGLGCPSRLSGQVVLTRDVALGDLSVRPPFGGTGVETAVTIDVDTSVQGVSFLELPRIYLAPSAGGPVVSLPGVGWIADREVTARVPAGLAAGTYDVIAVNPDGTVGVEAAGFLVTGSAPPQISSVSPGSVPGAGTRVKVDGAGFSDAAVTLLCQPEAGGAPPQSFPATGVQPEASGLSFLVPTGIARDSVCLVRVTDTRTGTFDEYSAIVVLNPAENLPPSRASSATLAVARRAPVAVVGEVTRSARFLYALGGDDGDPTGALDSAEVAPLSAFGSLGAWRTLPAPLPSPRTDAAGVVLGRFVYVVGGDDGGGPVSSAIRAEVLRTSDAPVISDGLTIALDPSGLGPGTWYYVVSAVMGPADPDNPGGETLPSEALTVVVPDWAPEGFAVTLRWSEVPGAAAYRLYRSPSADTSVRGLRRLAEVPAAQRSFTDAGGVTGGPAPRQLGDLGAWVALPALGAPRAALGLGVARDPVARATQYLYALGGYGAAGTPQTSWERLAVTPAGDGLTQGAWVAGNHALAASRADFIAYSVDAFATTVVGPTETQIFVGPGVGVGPAASRVQSALVQAGGALAPWVQASNGSLNRAGYGGTAVSNQLFLFGGTAGLASNDRDSGAIRAGGMLANVNATGTQLVVDRAWPGTTLGSGRIFLVGGVGTTGLPLDSVESGAW